MENNNRSDDDNNKNKNNDNNNNNNNNKAEDEGEREKGVRVFSRDMQMTVIEAVIQPKNGERANKWEKAAAQGIAGFRIHSARR